MAKIERWVFPHYDEMHIVQQPGNGLPELRSCLFGIDKRGEVAKILYCSQFGQFFTREKDGWHMQMPGYSSSRRKGWCKMPSGYHSCYPAMRQFGCKFCHILVAFAWCRRPLYITLPDGYYRPCYMDYERGRMYYRDHLLDAQGNFVQDQDGNYVFIDVYLQVDHLNGVHDDCNAENLEYVTSQENWRRRMVSNLIRKNGLEPKSMTYEQLRYAFGKEEYPHTMRDNRQNKKSQEIICPKLPKTTPKTTTMNTNDLNHKRVMSMAHIIYRRDCDFHAIGCTAPNWKRAVNDAWRIQDVRTAMQKGLVKLIYTKRNGEEVRRIGTLCADYIPGSKMPKGTGSSMIEPNYTTIAYYDITQGGWRSFHIADLITAVPVQDVSTPVYVNAGERLYLTANSL